MRTAPLAIAAFAALAGTLASPPRAAAQSAITGVVLDARTERPVAGAALSLTSDSSTSITQDDGRFRLPVAGAGIFVLETRHVAYALRIDTLRIGDGQNALLRILLVETAIELPPITVETRSRRLDDAGFFVRRERGIGSFFTRQDMEAHHVRFVADIFARVPGLRRAISSDGSSRVDSRGGTMISRRCEMQYFIDGVRSAMGPSGLDGIPVEIVEGIEVYRGGSEVPTQFDAGSAVCGAVLVWTRRG